MLIQIYECNNPKTHQTNLYQLSTLTITTHKKPLTKLQLILIRLKSLKKNQTIKFNMINGISSITYINALSLKMDLKNKICSKITE